MKKLIPLSLFIILFFTSRAQLNDTATIQVNNIAACFDAAGNIAFTDSGSLFEFPAGSGTNAVFAGAFWVTGFDDANNLHVAANRYPQGVTDFYPGPVALTYNANYDARYNYVWKVSAAEIDHHRQHFSDVGYIVPDDIYNWPGNGNTLNGEAAVLAPFQDLNQNSIYEPGLGEYPIIKGDEALFMLFNDSRGPHTSSNGWEFKMELHLMVYGFHNSGNVDIDNSLFLNLKIFNRSSYSYRDVTLSWWNDFDLGNFMNDRVGCDTALNTFFCYNDGYDIDHAGLLGYGSLPVSLGCTFLNSPLHSFAYFVNGFIPAFGEPSTAAQYRNYSTGFWNDGTPFTGGGSGYGGLIPTKFLLPGNPCDTSDWSDITSGFPAGDRRALGTMSSFSLDTNAFVCLDMAYVFSIGDSNSSCRFDGVNALKNSIQSAKNFFNTNNLSCSEMPSSISDMQTAVTGIVCYPNPTNELLTIESSASNIISLRLFDLSGRLLKVTNGLSSRMFVFSLEDLCPGMYVLEVETDMSVDRKMISKQ